MPSRTLEGLLVVAMEQAVAAPVCTSRLADAGARVIKVERPEGDFARRYDQAAGEMSSYFVWANRGKESLVADIKDAGDSALLHRMLARADIFVQNLAPGAAERAGFGAAALRAAHPRLITLDISGYGSGNSYSQMKAYDLLVQAETGLAELTGHPAGPGRVGISVCDVACGMYAHAALLEALLERYRTGEGCSIAVSLFDAVADWMNVPLLYKEGTGIARNAWVWPILAGPYGAFRSADGVLILISIQNEREWAAFCAQVLDDPDLPQRPGFDNAAARIANRAAVDGRVEATFAGLSAEQIASRLQAAGTAWGRVNDLDGLARHPALRRLPCALPQGSVDLIAPPALFDGASNPPGPVPAIGAQSSAIRAEFAA